MQNQFWVVLIQGKRYGFSVLQALPQTLAYMMGNPNPEMPGFGMITTGEDYLFIKLSQEEAPHYTLSHKFTLLSDDDHNLHRVWRVMKRKSDRDNSGIVEIDREDREKERENREKERDRVLQSTIAVVGVGLGVAGVTATAYPYYKKQPEKQPKI